jgi:hypothetical protein
VPHIAFLDRLRRLFGGKSESIARITAALGDGRLAPPAHPMSDQELSRAIREFQSECQGRPPSNEALKKLAERLAAAKPAPPS